MRQREREKEEERERGRSDISSLRVLITFMKVLPSWPNHFPNAPPPHAIKLRVTIPIREFWGNTNVRFITIGKELET